jgi:hypothetical protein
MSHAAREDAIRKSLEMMDGLEEVRQVGSVLRVEA